MIPTKATTLIEKTAKDLNADPMLTEAFINFCYSRLKTVITKETEPYIMIKNLGTFRIMSDKTEQLIQKKEQLLENIEINFDTFAQRETISTQIDRLKLLLEKTIDIKRLKKHKKEIRNEFIRNLEKQKTDS